MRKTYIDNIRWITVVLVVLYHVIYMFNGIVTAGVIGPFREVQYQDAFQYMVYPWFMLLLFVVSGMSARFYLNNHGHKEFIRTRTRKLLVPSTIGLLVFGWVMGYYNMLMSGAFESMGAVPKPVLYLIMVVSGTGPLWYIQELWLFSLLLVLFRKAEKDRLYNLCSKVNVPMLLLGVFAIWGSANILNAPVIVVYRFGIYGLGFMLGYLVFSHDEVMDRLDRWWLPLTVAAVVIGIAFTMLYWGKPYAEHVVLDTFMCNLFAWIATLAVLAFMKKWGNWNNGFTEWMTKQSWGLYIFHYLPLAMSAWYLTKYVPGMPVVVIYLLVGVAAFVGAFVLYQVISRIPVLRWCICGIGGKKNVRGKLDGTEKAS